MGKERKKLQAEIEVRFSILFGIHAQKNSLNKMLLELFGLFLFLILSLPFFLLAFNNSIFPSLYLSSVHCGVTRAYTIRCIRMEPNIHFWLLFLLSSSAYLFFSFFCMKDPVHRFCLQLVRIHGVESTWRQKLNRMQISNEHEQKKWNENGNDYLFGDVIDFRPI